MDADVADNASELRYELTVNGNRVGELRYRLEPGVVVLVHTEVDPAFEGRGLGTRLIQGALDDIRARGLRMTPQCPFVRAFVDRHPEYADLVAGR
ncbi:MAG TPA: GNAT family N-acetyltransferase [Gaiellaceae bacterium]|nr:GNAT family N-acetyltransferase [Gaiellaceae bacterium]